MQFVGGSISKGLEMQIEVAEFVWKAVEVTIKQIILNLFTDEDNQIKYAVSIYESRIEPWL